MGSNSSSDSEDNSSYSYISSESDQELGYESAGSDYYARALLPLHTAVRNSSVKRVKNLLKEVVDIDFRDSKGKTPLHHIWDGNFNVYIANELIEKQANVNALDNKNRTVLHLIAKHTPKVKNSEKLLQALLEKKVNVNVQDNDGNTSLHILLKKIKQQGKFSYNKNEKTNLQIDNFLSYGLDLKTLALQNNDGQTPLDIIFKKLLSYQDGTTETIQKWIRLFGLHVKDSDGKTILHYIPSYDQEVDSWIDFLKKNIKQIEEKNILFIKDNDGKTCLHYICQAKNSEIYSFIKLIFARLLQNNFAQAQDLINVQDNQGKTALDYLISNDSFHQYLLEILELFESKGLKIKSCFQQGQHLLASYIGNYQIIKPNVIIKIKQLAQKEGCWINFKLAEKLYENKGSFDPGIYDLLISKELVIYQKPTQNLSEHFNNNNNFHFEQMYQKITNMSNCYEKLSVQLTQIALQKNKTIDNSEINNILNSISVALEKQGSMLNDIAIQSKEEHIKNTLRDIVKETRKVKITNLNELYRENERYRSDINNVISEVMKKQNGIVSLLNSFDTKNNELKETIINSIETNHEKLNKIFEDIKSMNEQTKLNDFLQKQDEQFKTVFTKLNDLEKKLEEKTNYSYFKSVQQFVKKPVVWGFGLGLATVGWLGWRYLTQRA